MPVHPLTVHLPIGLAVVLILLLGGLYIREFGKEVREIILLTFCLFLVSLVVATITGRGAETELVSHSGERLRNLLRTHELIAYGAIWANGLLLIWMYLRIFTWQKTELLMFVFVFALICAGIFYSAHLGGTMVYQERAGVACHLLNYPVSR